MARHGRQFPIKAHVAPPIVGAAVVTFIAPPAKIVSLAGLGTQRRLLLKAHVASPIVGAAATPPPLVSQAQVFSVKSRPDRRILKAKVAPGIVGPALPLVTRPYILSRGLDRRSRKVFTRLPNPIVTPQAPPLWVKAYIARPAFRIVRKFGSLFAQPIVGPFVPPTVSSGGRAISGQATCPGAISGMAVCSGAISGQSLT